MRGEAKEARLCPSAPRRDRGPWQTPVARWARRATWPPRNDSGWRVEADDGEYDAKDKGIPIEVLFDDRWMVSGDEKSPACLAGWHGRCQRIYYCRLHRANTKRGLAARRGQKTVPLDGEMQRRKTKTIDV